MSENEADTKPTIQTILEHMITMEERIGVRLDRIESEVKKTDSEFYELRADFRELRNTLKEHIPAIR